MAKGSVATIFFQEVLDAIARNHPHVGDLVVLRDLCIAVNARDTPAVSRLARDLSRLSGVEDPLHSISYELFHALLTRILLEGWFEEFDLLMDWDETRFKTKDERAADKWEGIIKIVNEEPQSVELLTRAKPEKEWKRAVNGLDGAIRHFAKVRLPSPPTLGAPPIGPEYYERVLPQQLGEAIEQFFRVLQILFQQMLESALTNVERDVKEVQGLRKLQELQLALWKLLRAENKPPKEKPPEDRLDRVQHRVIRVAEVRYGRGRAKLHRFLDAFPPHNARSVIFNSLDREDKDEPYVRGEKIGSIQTSRDRQLAYYLNTYGHPYDEKEAPSAWHLRRRALITSKHGGRLKLSDNDDFVAFLSNYFEDRLAELTGQSANALPKAQASVQAWREAVDLWSSYFGQLSAHSRLNLTEGPPNYLTYLFPRNIGGRLLHDCGVYAVRTAYTLLSVVDRINRLQSDIAGTINARWVRFPLHVGLIIESSNFGLIVQHNDHLFVIDNDELVEVKTEWLTNRPGHDIDPADAAAATLKFQEDVAASAFSSDLDMPVSSTPVLGAGEPVTTQTIWNSYQKKVVPTQLFTGLVGASNAPQYQFDIRYLKLSEQEREWYNRSVLGFWNKDCNEIWKRSQKTLTDPATNSNQAALTKNKQAYIDALLHAIDILVQSYRKEILPEKRRLSADLRGDNKLVMPGVRIVAAERISTVLPSVTRVKAHIDEIFRPAFKFPRDFVPPFARTGESLLEVP